MSGKNHHHYRGKTVKGELTPEMKEYMEGLEPYLTERAALMEEATPESRSRVEELDAEYGPKAGQWVVEAYADPTKDELKQLRKYCLHRLGVFIQGFAFSFYRKQFVRYETLEDFMVDLNSSWQIRFRLLMMGNSVNGVWSENTYRDMVEKGSLSLQAMLREYPMLTSYVQNALKRAGRDYFHDQKYPQWVYDLMDEVTEEFFIENFSKSHQETNIAMYREYEQGTTMRLAMRAASEAMLNVMPEHYTDLFPMARQMKRHFILHVGPTNSGKTYHALQALRAAGGGIYLAPLRLLAFEKYSELTEDGYACTLVTGEERILDPNATFQASTIEMADFEKTYPLAVIDEAQMLEDESRGCRWTAAILGICAPEIHVCMAAHAEKLVERLITECGDTYEVIRHERNTKLYCSEQSFTFPDSVESGDALIVFSRRDVHAVAAQLKNEGKQASLIYGSLPYDVRQEQARLFREKVNDIVVATDAIGMGVNLPIRRVVLLETSKFDGTVNRPLNAGEVQQITGRAGRFGMYDEGVFTCEGGPHSEERNMLRHHSAQKIKDLTTAYVSFPETLLDIKLPVSSLLKKWDSLEKKEGYITSFVMRDRMLALQLEQLTDEVPELDTIADRRMIYSFAAIPFNEKSDELFVLWREAFAFYAKYHRLDEDLIRDNLHFNYEFAELEYLEQCSQVCDLFYQLVLKTDGGMEMLELVMDEKRKVSDAIIAILDKHEFSVKRCKVCGRELAFEYHFGICEKCFERRRNGRSRRGGHGGRGGK